MTNNLVKTKNVYLEKINENLSNLFRAIEKFNEQMNDLSGFANGAMIHINDIERILNSNDNNDDDDDDENERFDPFIDDEQESLAAEKLSELNGSLNTCIEKLHQSWWMPFTFSHWKYSHRNFL